MVGLARRVDPNSRLERAVSTNPNPPAEQLLASVSNAEIASCQIPSIFQDGFVEGMIVLGTSDERWLKNLYKACRKLVVVDEAPEGLPAVVSANFEGGRLAAQYLWERGHRSFALITGDRPNLNFQQRVDCFQSWIAEQLDAEITIAVFKGDAWADGGACAAQRDPRQRPAPECHLLHKRPHGPRCHEGAPRSRWPCARGNLGSGL